MAVYNDVGEEIPDNTPIELPLGFKFPPTLREEMQRIIRQELSDAAESRGAESFEEADDFELDEEDPLSQYELRQMQEEAVLPKDADRDTLDSGKVPDKEKVSGSVKVDAVRPSGGKVVVEAVKGDVREDVGSVKE